MHAIPNGPRVKSVKDVVNQNKADLSMRREVSVKKFKQKTQWKRLFLQFEGKSLPAITDNSLPAPNYYCISTQANSITNYTSMSQNTPASSVPSYLGFHSRADLCQAGDFPKTTGLESRKTSWKKIGYQVAFSHLRLTSYLSRLSRWMDRV